MMSDEWSGAPFTSRAFSPSFLSADEDARAGASELPPATSDVSANGEATTEARAEARGGMSITSPSFSSSWTGAASRRDGRGELRFWTGPTEGSIDLLVECGLACDRAPQCMHVYMHICV